MKLKFETLVYIPPMPTIPKHPVGLVNQDDTEKLKHGNLALNQLQRGDVQLSRQCNTPSKFT
jgi:hypothetical protein